MAGWEGREGGGLFGAEGPAEATITNPRFGYDSRYEDSTILVLKYDLEGPEVSDTQESTFLSMGKGWETSDGGKTVTHEDGAVEFVNTSNYFIFGAHALEVGAKDELISRGSSTEAKVWDGLRFMFERQTVGEGDFKRKVLLPVEYLGTGKTKPKTDKPTEAKVLRGLARLAKAAEGDNDEFVEEVNDEYPDLEDDYPDLWAKIVDEGTKGFA